ncbi:hypothetical protein [Streptomyces sp. HUCO-GS316]|nr:hypothetical protein [Streptomyces sp. HUCO-GS316]
MALPSLASRWQLILEDDMDGDLLRARGPAANASSSSTSSAQEQN